MYKIDDIQYERYERIIQFHVSMPFITKLWIENDSKYRSCRIFYWITPLSVVWRFGDVGDSFCLQPIYIYIIISVFVVFISAMPYQAMPGCCRCIRYCVVKIFAICTFCCLFKWNQLHSAELIVQQSALQMVETNEITNWNDCK